MYNINFNRLNNLLFHPDLKTVFNLSWVRALLSPSNNTYKEFLRYEEDVNYRLNLTGQVCKLEGALNDAFDKELRRITITDTQENTVILIHTDEAQNPLITHQEGQWQYIDSIPVIHDESAYADSGYDFNVNVPLKLRINQQNRLKNLLNTYKLASKRYKILYT